MHSGHIISLSPERTPSVSPSAWIAPGAVVVGDVQLHDAVSVWYNAVVRGDSASITVGEGSNLQDGVAVHVDRDHPTVIGAGVSVGHNAVVHGARIGNDTLIGMNATVLSGAQIGARCLIAAGALVPQGKVVPDGTLFAGVPGKIIRELSAEEQANLVQNANIYLTHTEHHRHAVDNMRPDVY